MERIKLVIVLPLGPDAKVCFVRDTLESILHYTTASRKIIILDDSGKNVGEKLKRLFPEVIVLKNSKCRGRKARLFLTLCKGFKFAFKHYIFDVLLKMDTDALLIGANPEDDAIRYFERHPECGSLGVFKRNCAGKRRDFYWNGRQLLTEMSAKYLLQHPHRRCGVTFFRKIFKKCRANGYKPGEHCQGGAHFISKASIATLSAKKLLSRREIWWSQQEDDVLLSLFISSTGLKHGDLATGLKPMGVQWRGLPFSPRELLARKKKIIHSTRFYQNLSEEEIRAFFRKRRQKKSCL